MNEQVTPHRSLSAVVLCDGGSEADRVTLPARKILELGLQPVPRGSGGVVTTTSSNNTRTTKLLFAPHVTVRLQFTRPHSTNIEERAVLALVTCREDEWNAAVIAVNEMHGVSVPATPPPPLDSASPVPDDIPLAPNIVAAVQLSPVGHRMRGAGVAAELSDETCAVGEGLLEKLGAHSNHVKHVLEIEEEVMEVEV